MLLNSSPRRESSASSQPGGKYVGVSGGQVTEAPVSPARWKYA